MCAGGVAMKGYRWVCLCLLVVAAAAYLWVSDDIAKLLLICGAVIHLLGMLREDC